MYGFHHFLSISVYFKYPITAAKIIKSWREKSPFPAEGWHWWTQHLASASVLIFSFGKPLGSPGNKGGERTEAMRAPDGPAPVPSHATISCARNAGPEKLYPPLSNFPPCHLPSLAWPGSGWTSSSRAPLCTPSRVTCISQCGKCCLCVSSTPTPAWEPQSSSRAPAHRQWQ